jgi:putative ABC transport system substrate-binding protein
MKLIKPLLGITLAFILLAAPFLAEAQQPQKVPRIGYLSESSGPAGSSNPIIGAFLQGLKELGYVEGKNIAIEYRFTERKNERLPEFAAELVRLNVDVIVTESGTGALQAKKATHTIPIVTGGSGDPVGQGLVSSLARPGGNVTGLTDAAPGLIGKRLQFLAEIVPKLVHVGVLWPGSGNPVMDQEWTETNTAAQQLNVQLHSLKIRGQADLLDAFAEAAKQQVQAVILFPWPTLLATAGKQIAELAVQNRLPTISHLPRYPQVGGLMSYGANPLEFFRRAASYVDRILKGANPADLPMEQPTKFMLVINMKTAKALGLTIPASILTQADQRIE